MYIDHLQIQDLIFLINSTMEKNPELGAEVASALKTLTSIDTKLKTVLEGYRKDASRVFKTSGLSLKDKEKGDRIQKRYRSVLVLEEGMVGFNRLKDQYVAYQQKQSKPPPLTASASPTVSPRRVDADTTPRSPVRFISNKEQKAQPPDVPPPPLVAAETPRADTREIHDPSTPAQTRVHIDDRVGGADSNTSLIDVLRQQPGQVGIEPQQTSAELKNNKNREKARELLARAKKGKKVKQSAGKGKSPGPQ